jgi:hypothetical protein
MMKKEYYILIVVLISLFLCIEQSVAKNNFVKVILTKGVTVDLPANWTVMSANKRITLDTWRESVLEARKLSDIENELAFTANYYDDYGNTAGTFAIRFYPNIKVNESEAIAAGAEFIRELDEGVKQNFKIGLEAGGGKLVSWLGTATQFINGYTYFISKNRQISPRGDKFRGTLVRYLNAGKSFTIIISYREDQEFYLNPICNKIISSIRQ